MKVCLKCGVKFDHDSWECPSCEYTPETRKDCIVFAPHLVDEIEGYNSETYEDQRQAGVEKHFWYMGRNNLIIWTLEHYSPHCKMFFEIGCGSGFVLSAINKALPQISLYASDALCEGLAFVKNRVKKVNLFQMDAGNLPFDNEFDVIGAFDVLEHIKEDKLLLSSMYSAAKKGGGIILTVPQHPFLWSKADDYACHVRRYTAKELRGNVESAGFRVVRQTSFISLLFPAMMAQRIFVGRHSDYDPTSEYSVNHVLNIFFKWILHIELACIRRGISFPFGGSLLLAAKKL